MKVAKDQVKVELIKKWLGAGSINIFGLPFSGKDTHGHILAKLVGGKLVGGGEIIRSKSSPQQLKDHVASGALAPTDQYLTLILPHIFKEEYADIPLILSTVGRWHGEEPSVMKAANESGHPIKAVIFLDVPKQEIIKRNRLSMRSNDRGQRHDDAEAALQKRFKEFDRKTLPVIEYYRQRDLLIEIDGSPPIESVNEEILNQLTQKAQSSKIVI